MVLHELLHRTFVIGSYSLPKWIFGPVHVFLEEYVFESVCGREGDGVVISPVHV